jgi:two-component system cell cycle sensor histidine kinase/response regulator CckA
MAATPHTLPAEAATILVVDDDPVVRDMAGEVLAEGGYHVRCVASRREALEIVAGERIDLVLSDVLMPQLDGPSLVRCLQAQGYGQPIVLMSAHTDRPSFAAYRRRGTASQSC